jgi:hypothetical protein
LHQKIRKYTKRPQNISNNHNAYQRFIKYTEEPQHTPNVHKNIAIGHRIYVSKFSTPRTSKIYQSWDFGMKIYIPSGNPVHYLGSRRKMKRERRRI